ncbi:ETS homologous factor isoform X2 [Mirounga angustirostris]
MNTWKEENYLYGTNYGSTVDLLDSKTFCRAQISMTSTGHLPVEQRGPVRVMYHLETGVSARPVAILSHPDGMLQPHPETYKVGEWSLLAFPANLPFQISEKPQSGAGPPADNTKGDSWPEEEVSQLTRAYEIPVLLLPWLVEKPPGMRSRDELGALIGDSNWHRVVVVTEASGFKLCVFTSWLHFQAV